MKAMFNLSGKRFQRKHLPFILVLCMFCSFSATVNGQTIPRLPNCADTPLHPMAGKTYTYAVTIPAPYTTPQSYDWYVTDNPGFIAGSVLITTGIIPNTKEFIDAGTGYHNTATGTNSITIQWTGKAVANAKTKPYFLVIHYKGTNGTLCEAMNMRAYKIEPFNAFTLDLTNMNNSTDLGLDGSNLAVTNRVCAKDIASVSYDGTKMVYDYGVNDLVFKVVAANFTGGWTPTVKVSGLAAAQTIGSIEWSETTTFNGTNPFTKNGDNWSPANKVLAPADNQTKRRGDHLHPGISKKIMITKGSRIRLLYLPWTEKTDDGEGDVHYADCLTDGFTNDIATQIILARPTITSNTGTPVQSFLP